MTVTYIGAGSNHAEPMRRESLRRQVVLMEHIRDAVAAERADDARRWAEALIPLTDALLHELMALEGVPPYPHPMGEGWDALLARDTASKGGTVSDHDSQRDVGSGVARYIRIAREMADLSQARLRELWRADRPVPGNDAVVYIVDAALSDMVECSAALREAGMALGERRADNYEGDER